MTKNVIPRGYLSTTRNQAVTRWPAAGYLIHGLQFILYRTKSGATAVAAQLAVVEQLSLRGKAFGGILPDVGGVKSRSFFDVQFSLLGRKNDLCKK